MEAATQNASVAVSSGGGAVSALAPAFRSYVSVELPFTMLPTVATTTTADSPSASPVCAVDAADRRAVEAFVPPSFLVPCVHRPVPQRLDNDRGAGGADSQSDAETPDEDDAVDDDDAMDSSSSDVDSAVPDTAAAQSSAIAAVPTRADTGRRAGLRLDTRHRRRYCALPIFSGWRGTDWGLGCDNDEDAGQGEEGAKGAKGASAMALHGNEGRGGTSATAAAEAEAAALKRRRREIFSSIEPQLLLHGYYRNDLLVEVRRRRRVRRYRDPATHAVVREEEEELGVEDGAAVRAEVVGVVSRELELARPADFTFALFSPEQQQAAPSLCGADLFPPRHYLSPRALFEVRYEAGRAANTTVTAPGAAADDNAGTGTAAQGDLAKLPMLSVGVEASAELPTRHALHESYLRWLGSSLEGRLPSDPDEVRVVVQLLDARPVWGVANLLEAMLQSGQCPGMHRSKQAMLCFTYYITNGPFNRLRMRLGYDPYASPASVVYERVGVRLQRRSDVGARVRDVSRSPHVESVLRVLLERDQARREAYQREPGHAWRLTLLEVQCRIIKRGQLFVAFQLADVLDDPGMAALARDVDGGAEAPMPLPQRGQQRGWLSEAAYRRVGVYFAEALATMLRVDVEPLLRQFQGPAVGVGAGAGAGAGVAATVAGAPEEDEEAQDASKAAAVADSDDEMMEDEDDEMDDDDSAMSSATMGDLSSPDDGDDE